jgi:hypothetical protein
MANHDLLREVGEMALAAFDGPAAKLLVYAEVEDGVSSADLFADLVGAGKVTFRFAPARLRQTIYEFWETGNAMVQSRSWATCNMVIEGSQFNLDLVYPADLAKDEDLSDRRPRVVEQVFPGKTVDYSNPGRG